MIGALYPALLLCAVILMIYKRRREEPEEEDDGFSYLTVREQIALANQTAQEIGTAEQLITDMEESTCSDIIIVHLEWIGRDAAKHEMHLQCDGINTATECIIAISEREVNDLKDELAHQCAVLSDAGRNRRNGRRNAGYQRGGESVDETVSMLRDAYLDG